MRNIYIGLILFLLSSCGQKEQKSVTFDKIDLSIYNGWTDFYCFNISGTGKAYIFNDKHGKGKIYYSINLSSSELDSVSLMIKRIITAKIDTFYENRCVDCGRYNVIIQTENKTIKSFVEGIPEQAEAELLNNLAVYLYNIGVKTGKTIDSSFVFKSRTKLFYPPWPPDSLLNN